MTAIPCMARELLFCFLQMKRIAGMSGSEDGTLLRHGNMRIDFCDMNGTVTKHFLYIADIDVRF